MNAALSADEISLFLLVLARVSGLVSSAPILGDAQVPGRIKAALAVLLSFVLVQIPSVAHGTAPTSMLPFSIAVLGQLIIGLVLGFVARLAFFALQTAGGIISLVMGLSVAAVLDPLTHSSDSPLSELYMVVAGMTFLAVRGDELVVAALARSFDLTPFGTPIDPAPIAATLVDNAALVSQVGVQIAMPIAASLIASNVILGIVSRSIPQLNLFVLAMPINIMLGLLALVGSLAGMMLITGNFMQDVPRTMLSLLPAGR